uniref:Uncharacterized protein n=1 Tax=Bosea sp. NBC_00436 TaxID=2969620 RepID=A0A9E8CLC0_9HYPH
MRPCAMRTGISITLGEADRRLEALVVDGDTAPKHVWRVLIVLMSADGIGASAIAAPADTAKMTVRRPARFMEEGVDGLLRNKTRPPGRLPAA